MESLLNQTGFEGLTTVAGSRNYCANSMDDLNLVLVQLRSSITPIDRYVSFVWFTIGFPGNFLSFFIWIRRKMRPSSGCYLAALAFNDFVFLLVYILADVNNAWEKRILNVPVFCELMPVFFLTTQYLSPFFVLAFTVERYISICHPYQRDKYCTTKRAVIVIICFIALTLTLQSSQAYFWHYHEEWQSCNIRESVVSSRLWTVFNWITEMQAFVIVPTAITVINIRVIVEIKRVSKRTAMYTSSRNSTTGSNHISSTGGSCQSATTSSSSSQSATTVMLLVVSFFYIISTLPVAICYASFPILDSCLTLEEIKEDPNWQATLNYWNVRIVVQELGLSHYACNIIFYLLTGSQFRAELKTLLKKIICLDYFETCLKKKNSKFVKCCFKDESSSKANDSTYSFSNSRMIKTKDNSRHISVSYSGEDSLDNCKSTTVELTLLKQSHAKVSKLEPLDDA